MTILQVLSSFFYILIYPFLIRVLGKESYGTYVFILSVVTYCNTFLNFGFDFPAVKSIAQHSSDNEIKSETVSCVFIAKIYLLVLTTISFFILAYIVPILKDNFLLLTICYLQVIGGILFPIWFFQGIQKMRWVTYINLGFKLLTLPFIFLFIKEPADCWIYALIVTLSTIGGGMAALYIIIKYEAIRLKWYPWKVIIRYYKEALPFFWSTSTGVIKQQSTNVLVGSFMGMSEVAVYDLAYKIIQLPQILTMNINGALFPNLIKELKATRIKKILLYEGLLGIGIILGIGLLGKWIVLLLGGESMIQAYPLAVILSITVLTWLVVGGYISYVFVPHHKYYWVTKNQIVAFVTFLAFCSIGLFFWKSIWIIAFSLAFSGLCEVFYCYFLTRKNKLLEE